MSVRRVVSATSVAAVICLGLAACDAGSTLAGGDADEPGSSTAGTDTGESAEQAARIKTNVARGATDVAVDTVVRVQAAGASLSSVAVTSAEGDVAGAMSEDGATWTAEDLLEPGVAYTVKAVGSDSAGDEVRERSTFTTQALTLAEQTFASVSPLQGETVGVGMPISVSFDIPVTDKAAFEKKMTVTTAPEQTGSWRWVSDTEARYRPKSYWEPGTEVTVDVGVNGVAAGNGIYGQESRTIDFTIGDAHVYKVNAQTHQMRVFSNGELLRTIPITTGKAGFTTRSGTKVIASKHETYNMNSSTIGIDPESAEGYDISNVQYAMRLTNSGEFIHAAPWSVSSQGSANVSHGCTGMSVADAGYLYNLSQRGDVVEYVGTDRPMTLDNGFGDWNTSFADYKQGSAL